MGTASSVDRPTVLLVNPMDKIRPEVVKLASQQVTDHVELRVLVPERCRDSVPENDAITYLFYDARFVPNIRYTIPTLSFLAALRSQYETVDVVHTLGYVYFPSLVTVLFATWFQVSTVITVDAFPGESWSYGNRVVDAVAKLYTHLFAGPMFSAADAVVGLGEYIQSDFETFVDDDSKVSIIPNGVDTDRYSPPAPIRETDATYETDGHGGVTTAPDTAGSNTQTVGSPTKLLYVGRLDTVKGIPYLLDAIAKLRRDDDRAYTLTVVGDGSRRDDWETRCRELDIADVVTFEGWQTDVVPYYRSHDVFVLSSISEGLPTVITEAQSCGLPVVSTDVGGAREQVRGGTVVPTKDPDALATAISELSRRDLTAQGAVARAHVESAFSLDTMSDAYVQLYGTLSS